MLLPRSDLPLSDPPPPPPPASSKHHKNSFPFSLSPRRIACLITFFLLQLLLFLSLRPSLSVSTAHLSTGGHHLASGRDCSGGLIYVYELPPKFNSDLLAICDELAPWYSLCPYLANSGLGHPVAGTNLSTLLPASLLPSWFSSDQFALEHIVHSRLLSHRCRTTDSSLASAFYVPFYAGLAVGRHLWSPNATDADRDRDCVLLLQLLHQTPFYQRSHGWDHFLALGRITWDFRRTPNGGWGGSFLTMPGMANITRLVIERDPWDDMDVGIPYPTGFHPRAAADVRAWQQFVLRRARSKLFAFAGAPRSAIKGDFRGLLLNECHAAGDQCGALDCAEGKCIKNNALVMELFMGAQFCLQPRGDSFTRRSLFDCMVAGAVPVLFWRRSAYRQYGWFMPVGRGEEEEWSVFIDRGALRAGNVSMRAVLQGIGEARARRMRERVVEMIPRLVYSAAGTEGLGDGLKDAVDIAVDGMLKRADEQRRHWRKT